MAGEIGKGNMLPYGSLPHPIVVKVVLQGEVSLLYEKTIETTARFLRQAIFILHRDVIRLPVEDQRPRISYCFSRPGFHAPQSIRSD